MALPKVGLTYPTTTGESKTQAFNRLLAEYPAMKMWSTYENGTDLPVWTDGEYVGPPDMIYLLSVKTTDMNALGARLATMPVNLRGRVYMFIHHEPDQWRSATDPRSDPAPAVWKTRNEVFASLRNGAVWEYWIQHWACFTEDRYRTDRPTWMANWGDWVLGVGSEILDGNAWDVFNIGRTVVRTGAEMFQDIVTFNRAAGLPMIIREWGQVTPVDQATDSTMVANAIADQWEWVKGNALDTMVGMVWYYNHNNVLTDPTTVRRPLSRAVVSAIVNEAGQPDPCAGVYDDGYQTGRASRQSEVDDLNAQIVAAEAAIEQLQVDVDNAKAAGRLEAFGETVIWAQQQS